MTLKEELDKTKADFQAESSKTATLQASLDDANAKLKTAEENNTVLTEQVKTLKTSLSEYSEKLKTVEEERDCLKTKSDAAASAAAEALAAKGINPSPKSATVDSSANDPTALYRKYEQASASEKATLIRQHGWEALEKSGAACEQEELSQK